MPDIDLSLIRPDPNNVRVAPATADEDAALETSIREHGLLQPILLRPDPGPLGVGPDSEVAPIRRPDGPRYIIVAGHRRYKAAKALGLATIVAEVREFATDAAVTLAQIEENEVRTDMADIDVWGAVEVAARTLSAATIAVKMGLDERTVRRYIAMGGMSEKLKAHIRSVDDADDLPEEVHVGKIIAASHERQDQVLAGQLAADGRVCWWKFARDCDIARIPMKFARFERDEYPKDKVHTDLFGTIEDTDQATDPDLFLQLQHTWAESEVNRRLKGGWGKALMVPVNQYGQFDSPMPGVKSWDLYNLDDDHVPKRKSERKLWGYLVTVRSNGQVLERAFKLPSEEEAQAALARGAPATTSAAPAPGPKGKPDFTKAGVEKIEAAKRAAAAAAVEVQDDPYNLLIVAALLLYNKAGHGTGKPDIRTLYQADGTLDFDHADRNALALQAAKRVIAYHLTANGMNEPQQPLVTVERVGHGLGGVPKLPVDEETLSTFNKERLERFAGSRGFQPCNTQKQLRANLIRNRGEPIRASDLPELAWKVVSPAQARALMGSSGQTEGAEASDYTLAEEEDDEFCGKKEGRRNCPCDWSAAQDEEIHPCHHEYEAAQERTGSADDGEGELDNDGVDLAALEASRYEATGE